MTVHLTLHAELTHLLGFGQASPPKGSVRLELRDPGTFAVVRPRIRRDQDLMTMAITGLELRTGNRQISSGGGFAGGGIGITGAVVGIAAAGALNAMSRRHHEHTTLTAHEELPNGARRQAGFAFATLSESQLRDELARTLTPWADAYLALATREADPLDCGDDLRRGYAQIDEMHGRGMLTAEQARGYCSHVSRPFVTAIRDRLAAGQVPYEEAQRLQADVLDLRRNGRIDDHQAHLLVEPLTAIPAPLRSSGDERIAQLQALAELRQSGALTEDEFQTEKARLLRGGG